MPYRYPHPCSWPVALNAPAARSNNPHASSSRPAPNAARPAIAGPNIVRRSRQIRRLASRPLRHLERLANTARQHQRAHMRVRDVEPHVRRIRTPDRDLVSRLGHGNGICRAARVRINRRQRPRRLRADDRRQLIQRKPSSAVNESPGRSTRERSTPRAPRRCSSAPARRQLAQPQPSITSLARSGSAIAHNRLLARRYVNRACSSSLSSATETSATSSSASCPRPSHDSACARMNMRLGSAASAPCRLRQPIRERQIRHRNRAPRGLG